MMPIFVEAAERMITREASAIGRMKTPSDERITKFYEGHHGEVAAAFTVPIATLANMVGADVDGIAERYADQHVGESRRRLDEGENPEDWSVGRPAWIAQHLTDLIAITETDEVTL